MTATPVLELRGVKKWFGGIRAVDGVEFSIEEAERVALIGPNGAGKTTLFSLLLGEIAPTAGEILLDAESILRLPPHKRVRLGIGRSFQITRVFSALSVRENLQIAFLARRRGLRSYLRPAHGVFDADVGALLKEVRLDTHADRETGTLAQGEKKRLELAMVLALEPRILLLDEPTAGMGVEERGAIMRVVNDVVERRRLTMLFTEHDMETVFAHAQRIIVMDHGVPIADGRPEDVRGDAQVQEIYLGRYAAGKAA